MASDNIDELIAGLSPAAQDALRKIDGIVTVEDIEGPYCGLLLAIAGPVIHDEICDAIEAMEENGDMVSKAAANYTDQSASDDQCGRCDMYRPADRCTKVIGVVNPQGWCEYFCAKA